MSKKVIRPNTHGKVQKARKQLRRHLGRLQSADTLTAGQRDALYAQVLSDLARIQMYQLGEQDIT